MCLCDHFFSLFRIDMTLTHSILLIFKWNWLVGNLKIVPTLVKFKNGTSIQTNQYSVTEHLRHVNPGGGRGLPGVFFFYEISPLHVEIVEDYRKGYLGFFTSVCAIVGGVVTTMGLLDQILYSQNQRSSGRGQGLVQ